MKTIGFITFLFGLCSFSWAADGGSQACRDLVWRLSGSSKSTLSAKDVIGALTTGFMEKGFRAKLEEHYSNLLSGSDQVLVPRTAAEMERFDKRLDYLDSNPSIGQILKDFQFQPGNDFNRDIGLVLILNASLKPLVWEAGFSGRTRLAELGVDPSKFWNIHSLGEFQAEIQKLDDFEKVKPKLLSRFSEIVEEKTGYSWEALQADLPKQALFTDELVASWRETLLEKKNTYLKHPGVGQYFQDQLRKWDPDERLDIVPRSHEMLLGGSLAGDCTKLGNINDWTNASWIGTFENIEFRYYVRTSPERKPSFFARFVAIASEREGRPVLFVHAVEFSPLVRPKGGNATSGLSDSEKQSEWLMESLTQIAHQAARAGFEDVVLTRISNSEKFASSLAILRKDGRHQLPMVENQSIRLLNPLDSTHQIQHSLRGHSEPVEIHLQDWMTASKFSLGDTKTLDQGLSETINGRVITVDKIRWASNALASFLMSDEMADQISKALEKMSAQEKGDLDPELKNTFSRQKKKELFLISKPITPNQLENTDIMREISYEAELIDFDMRMKKDRKNGEEFFAKLFRQLKMEKRFRLQLKRNTDDLESDISKKEMDALASAPEVLLSHYGRGADDPEQVSSLNSFITGYSLKPLMIP